MSVGNLSETIDTITKELQKLRVVFQICVAVDIILASCKNTCTMIRATALRIFSPNCLGVYAITETIQTTMWEICQIATVTLSLPSKDTLVLKSHFPSNFSNLTSWLYSLIQSSVSILFIIFFAYLLSSPWYLRPYNSCQSDNMLNSWHNLSFKANRTQRLAHPWKLLWPVSSSWWLLFYP